MMLHLSWSRFFSRTRLSIYGNTHWNLVSENQTPTPKGSCSHLLLRLLTVELAVLDDFDGDGRRAPDFDAFEHFAKGALPQDALHLEGGGLGREEASGDQAVALRRRNGFHPFSSEGSSEQQSVHVKQVREGN